MYLSDIIASIERDKNVEHSVLDSIGKKIIAEWMLLYLEKSEIIELLEITSNDMS